MDGREWSLRSRRKQSEPDLIFLHRHTYSTGEDTQEDAGDGSSRDELLSTQKGAESEDAPLGLFGGGGRSLTDVLTRKLLLEPNIDKDQWLHLFLLIGSVCMAAETKPFKVDLVLTIRTVR